MTTTEEYTRPWQKRGEELFEKEGMYSDYAAWIEFMGSQPEPLDTLLDHMDDADPLWKIQLYSLMCDLCDKRTTPAPINGSL